MKKVLFFTHDLGNGGAEKVLVNLVNHLNPKLFQVTLISLFGGGVNEQFLAPHIEYRTILRRTVRGNSKLMKLLSPRRLHRMLLRDRYDVEIAFLEGPATRIIGGCESKETKLIAWVHCTLKNQQEVWRSSFRTWQEAKHCYLKMQKVVCVSQNVQDCFLRATGLPDNTIVRYNVNETEKVQILATEPVPTDLFKANEIHIISVGRIIPIKGFMRLARIHEKLRNAGYPVHCYILGTGSEKKDISAFVNEHALQDSFTFLGYQANPYQYVAKCDLFVCSSFSEGFSTAATEALIVGTPVCTVDVSGMKEMLGEHNEYGVVTENSEEALYQGIKQLLDDPILLKHYKEMAVERGKAFSTEETVKAVEDMLLSLD